MVATAQRDGKLIAHLSAQRAILRKPQVMCIRGSATSRTARALRLETHPLRGISEKTYILGVNFWYDFKRLNLRIDSFLDVGANIGQWAADARLNYPSVAIFSIEPEPQDFNTLRQHFQNDRHHHAIQCAVSDQIGTAELRVGGGTTNSLESRWTPLLGPSQRSIIIQTDTIDHIAQRFNLEHIALLKIDVEGHELQCIKGADRMLQEGRIAILVEVGFVGGIHTLFADIEKLLDEHGHHFLALYDLAPDYSGHARAFFANALFCRDELRLIGW